MQADMKIRQLESVCVYCDESCHLENDHQEAMVIGALWCPEEQKDAIARDIRGIKALHGRSGDYEIKWTRVSKGLVALYLELVEYFFSEREFKFRAVVVPDKSILRHCDYGQSHDDFYYKMYFQMLRFILDPNKEHKIFLDIKDTRGGSKVRKLREVLCNDKYDFDQKIIGNMQQVRSEEVQQMQLADLIIGCISAANRSVTTSPAKHAVIDRLKSLSGYDLRRTTLLREEKVNLLRWEGREGVF